MRTLVGKGGGAIPPRQEVTVQQGSDDDDMGPGPGPGCDRDRPEMGEYPTDKRPRMEKGRDMGHLQCIGVDVFEVCATMGVADEARRKGMGVGLTANRKYAIGWQEIQPRRCETPAGLGGRSGSHPSRPIGIEAMCGAVDLGPVRMSDTETVDEVRTRTKEARGQARFAAGFATIQAGHGRGVAGEIHYV